MYGITLLDCAVIFLSLPFSELTNWPNLQMLSKSISDNARQSLMLFLEKENTSLYKLGG